MPWTPEEFKKKHNQSLTDAQAKIAARIANGILRDTGDEAKAIKIANARVKMAKD